VASPHIPSKIQKIIQLCNYLGGSNTTPCRLVENYHFSILSWILLQTGSSEMLLHVSWTTRPHISEHLNTVSLTYLTPEWLHGVYSFLRKVAQLTKKFIQVHFPVHKRHSLAFCLQPDESSQNYYILPVWVVFSYEYHACIKAEDVQSDSSPSGCQTVLLQHTFFVFSLRATFPSISSSELTR
jgi:hypothetical protein